MIKDIIRWCIFLLDFLITLGFIRYVIGNYSRTGPWFGSVLFGIVFLSILATPLLLFKEKGKKNFKEIFYIIIFLAVLALLIIPAIDLGINELPQYLHKITCEPPQEYVGSRCCTITKNPPFCDDEWDIFLVRLNQTIASGKLSDGGLRSNKAPPFIFTSPVGYAELKNIPLRGQSMPFVYLVIDGTEWAEIKILVLKNKFEEINEKDKELFRKILTEMGTPPDIVLIGSNAHGEPYLMSNLTTKVQGMDVTVKIVGFRNKEGDGVMVMYATTPGYKDTEKEFDELVESFYFTSSTMLEITSKIDYPSITNDFLETVKAPEWPKLKPRDTENQQPTKDDIPDIQPSTEDSCNSCISVGEMHWDAMGDDCTNLNDEYAVLQNICQYNCDLTGWQIRDAAGRNPFTFPRFTLKGTDQVTVYTGCGTNTGTKLYWCNSGNNCNQVWGNNGDALFLLNPMGIQVKSYIYQV